jgi:hypothetical protein
MGDDDVSKLPYMEVQYQLQILEHIADKGPLSQGDLALQRLLEARERDLVQAKLSQGFDGAARSSDGSDNREAWKTAVEYGEFRSKAEALAHRHLQNESRLADKHQKGVEKFGTSPDLEAVHAGEQKLEARHYDEERGRFAREFLAARELKEQLEEDARQRDREPGKEYEP